MISSRETGMAQMHSWSETMHIAYDETTVPFTSGNGGTSLLGTSTSIAGCSTWNGPGFQQGKPADHAPLMGRDDIILRDGIVRGGAFHRWRQELVLPNARIPRNGNQVLFRKCLILLREQGRHRDGGTQGMDFGSGNESRDYVGDVPPGGWATRHVMCERARRRTESQWIATLRTLLPNLNKMDKASVLGRTADYIGELHMAREQLRMRKRRLEEGGGD
eukprot:TRINITY_DN521_c0_g1_i8.p1 TRINITY_DN521_c0_g1~~TRINITY_DN521_c0_g1_i8.p1  ORF type:complete len:219 (-),score=16.92 TRINITY_DN521_c0_g1_i8:1821-2477(-)